MSWLLLDICVFGSYDFFPVKNFKKNISLVIKRNRICIAFIEPHAKLLECSLEINVMFYNLLFLLRLKSE